MHDIALPGPLPRPAARSVAAGLFVWLLTVAAVALLGVLSIERRGLIPLGILGGTIALVGLYLRGGALRAVADAIDIRIPILLHVVRAPVGFGFLVIAARGGLDPVFAEIAGWGDIAVGLSALAVAAGGARVGPGWRRARLAWNLFGLVDILVVLVIAQSILLFSDHPETMGGLIAFPWPFVPLFLVPLVIATHLLLFKRLRR